MATLTICLYTYIHIVIYVHIVIYILYMVAHCFVFFRGTRFERPIHTPPVNTDVVKSDVADDWHPCAYVASLGPIPGVSVWCTKSDTPFRSLAEPGLRGAYKASLAEPGSTVLAWAKRCIKG